MIRILILSVLPGLVLIIQNGVWVKNSNELLNDNLELKENVVFTLEVSAVVHRLQIERGLTSLFLVSGETKTDYGVEALLQEGYRKTDKALEGLSGWLYTNISTFFNSKGHFCLYLNNYRTSISNLTFHDAVKFYSAINAIFIHWMVDVFEHRDTELWSEFVAFQLLANGKEKVGIERALGVMYYTTGQLSQDTLMWYKAAHELALSFLDQFKDHSRVGTDFMNLYIDDAIADDAYHMRTMLLSNETHISNTLSAIDWINNMTAYINELDQVFRAMAGHLTKKTDTGIRENRIELITDIIIVVLTIIIVPLLNMFVYKLTKKMEDISIELQDKTINLEKEQKRTESLLSQLIPAKIAKRMKKNTVYPEHFDHVTVMFSDICDFSTLVGNCSPEKTIRLVNDVFDILDKRISVHNVSKIGSIGNVLLVGSGLHQRHTDRHAVDIATLALDLLGKIQNLDSPNLCGQKVRLKIGINTGPVVTGVVQGTFPRFCVYGATTTIAHTLMMACLPQRILIADSTRKALESHEHFVIRERLDTVTQITGCLQKTHWLVEASLSVTHLEADLGQSREI